MIQKYLKISGLCICLQATASFCNCAFAASPVDFVVDSLQKHSLFSSTVNVEVSLPMAADDVRYTVEIASQPSPADTLSPINYLIDWTLHAPDADRKGFTSYFNGNLYRFRDDSPMNEYHFSNNPLPFISATPVQNTTQFIDLFPVNVAREINEMSTDPSYKLSFTPDSIFNGQKAAILKARRSIADEEVANLLYVFEPEHYTLRRIEKELSPGSISEQTVVYTYEPGINNETVPTSEAELVQRYPDAFSNFREGNYGLQSLMNRPVPSFSLPTLDSQRFNYSKGSTLNSPTLMVFLDYNVGNPEETINLIRNAADILPMNTDILWIFLSNRRDDIEEIITPAAGETVLLSGNKVVKDFGITSSPTIIFVDRDGIIKDYQIGFNNNLSDIVLQKASLSF